MNSGLKKFLIASLTLMLALSNVMIFGNVVAQARPSVYIDPALNQFFTNTTSVGQGFTVSIKTADWVNPGVFSYQLKVFFNTSMLNVTAAGMGVGHFLTPVNPSKIFVVDDGLVDYEAGSVSFAATLLNPEAPKTGSGTLATITFKIIAAPPSGQTLSSLIELKDKDTKMVDSNADEIPKASYDRISGTYAFISPPAPRPSLAIESKTWTTAEADAANSLFNVSVTMNDLRGELNVIATQFRLSYDTALLATKTAWVFEGSFFDAFGDGFFTAFVDQNVIAGELKLPPWPGTLGFPNGDGVLAIIQFIATGRPAVNAKNVTGPLTLSNVKVLDTAATEVGFDHLVQGTYTLLGPPRPVLTVSSKSWTTADANAANGLFNITVSISGLVEELHVVAVQFSLSFDTTLLATRTEWIFEGSFLKAFGDTFFTAFVNGNVIAGQLQLPPWPGPTDHWANGNGVLAIIQFNATARPAALTTSGLTLSGVRIINANAQDVGYDKLISGKYQISSKLPWFSLSPDAVEVESLGDTFSLNVVINELDKALQMVGVEFKIRYDTSLLSTKKEWITEGTNNIMRAVAEHSGTNLFIQIIVEEDYGLIGIILLPLSNGTWPFFPEGTGLLSAIQFQSLQQAATENIETSVFVDDPLLVNSAAKPIPTDEDKTADQGKCTVTLLKSAAPPPSAIRQVDVYTQYVAPYGGQGQGVVSDAFAPQGQVELNALVTYRGEPVPFKPVSLRIQGPSDLDTVQIVFSDDSGVALLEYSIPASSKYFGVWNVTASVDIAGVVVNDVVSFRVGWLLEVKSITVSPNDGTKTFTGASYQTLYKGKTYTLGLNLAIYTMQEPQKCMQLSGLEPKVLLAYTGKDELNQAIFGEYIGLTTIGRWLVNPTPAQMEDFVYNRTTRGFSNGQIMVTIARSSYTGVATIYANLLTDYPWASGVPYSDPAIGKKEVWIELNPLDKKPQVAVSTAFLGMSSASTTAGQTFSIAVNIGDVDPDEQMVAIQFTILYDTKLMAVANVVEGSFMKQFGDTFFVTSVDPKGGQIVGELQLPPWPGENGWPVGSGTIATIQFQALKAGSAFLTLTRASVVNNVGTRLQIQSLLPGTAEIS